MILKKRQPVFFNILSAFALFISVLFSPDFISLTRAAEAENPAIENKADQQAQPVSQEKPASNERNTPPAENGEPCHSPSCKKKKLPSFRVVFHNSSGQSHLLVSPRTSGKEIENLVYFLAEARKNNGFDKIGIPPGNDAFTRGSILIFKEIRWAKGEKLTNPRVKEKTYGHHVMAEYIWNSGNEIAYIGQRTLFTNSLNNP